MASTPYSSLDAPGLQSGLEGFQLLLLDVRSGKSWKDKRVSGAANIPVLDIDEAFDPAAVEEVEFFLWYGFLRPKSRRIRIVVMCEDGGKQSTAAAGKLRKLGFLGTEVFRGGMEEWVRQDGPVVSS